MNQLFFNFAERLRVSCWLAPSPWLVMAARIERARVNEGREKWQQSSKSEKWKQYLLVFTCGYFLKLQKQNKTKYASTTLLEGVILLDSALIQTNNKTNSFSFMTDRTVKREMRLIDLYCIVACAQHQTVLENMSDYSDYRMWLIWTYRSDISLHSQYGN